MQYGICGEASIAGMNIAATAIIYSQDQRVRIKGKERP
jgi:hypothetical protein